jgi:hypothetical protein
VKVEVEENPLLVVDTNKLVFDGNVFTKKLTISNGGGGRLEWKLQSFTNWIIMSDSSGVVTDGMAEIAVSVNASGLGAGRHTGVIVASYPAGTLSITVELEIELREQTGDVIIEGSIEDDTGDVIIEEKIDE